jgi:anti-sigma factor RsiW
MKDDTTLLHGEAELHAFVDGRLDAAAHAAVQARLAREPETAAQVWAWIDQRAALSGLHDELLREPVPPSLVAAAQQLHHRSSRLGQWQRWGGMAASLLLAFGIGWGGHAQWRTAQDSSMARAPAKAFAREAVIAHAVYSPEVRHPVEVDAKQQDHLVQWLSKRLNRPLKVPNLGPEGYTLVGGRLLPGNGGARAQFMYQNAAGQRLTLYVGAIDPGKKDASQETSFRFVEDGAVHGFYWVDQGFGYALSGELPRGALQDVATAVYRQLQG